MRKDITIAAEARETRGKNEARRTRVRGLVPAIVYGAAKDPVSISVDPKEVTKILVGSGGFNSIFNLSVTGGENVPVIVTDYQLEPIKGRVLHFDMKRVDLTKKIVVKIPVHTSGEAKGVKLQGGLLESITREVEIEVLPDDIPEQFMVDVANLSVGEGIRASDLPMSGSMRLVSPGDSLITHVISLKAEEPVAGAEGATGAEPEVIKKGKKEDDTKAAAPAKGGKAAPAATKAAAPAAKTAAKPAADKKKK